MPTQASQFDLLTAFLDTPVPLQYGLVRGAGKLVLQHELSDKYRIACYLLGEGPWDSLLRLWINRLSVSLPDTTKVHFHPGDDGEIGAGMAATSTGGDQKVDAFWTSLPGSLSVVDFSRFAHLWVKVPPDPGAPGPELEVLGDYQAMKVRVFDNAGAQTSFAWSQNWVWCAVDKLLRKLVLREARVNQPLIADQKALFDFGLLKTAADYADFDIGGGVKRFSDGGLVWIDDGLTADRAAEQLLLMCRSFLGERNGKIFVMERKDEASSFTLTLDDIEAGSFVVEEGIEEGAFNQVIPALRDSALASGSSDNLTRMAEATPEPLNHESHQLATGFAGKGLARIRDAVPLSLDLGVNTAERAWRIGKSLLLETLGDDADPGVTYTGLRRFSVVGLEHTVEIVPGDVITIDRGVSEEWSGAKFRVQKAVERPDGKRELSGRQHNPNAYPDTAPAQQATEPPAPGTGLAPITAVAASTGGQYVTPGVNHESEVRELESIAEEGDTTASAFTTVDQFDIELSPLSTSFKGKLTVSKIASSIAEGPKSPTSGTGTGWTNPGNILASDNAYADVTLLSAVSNPLIAKGFDFSAIPSGAQPIGILVEWETKSTGTPGTRIVENSIRLRKSGGPVGDNKSAAVEWFGSDTYMGYGGATDLWNAGLTLADVQNSEFGSEMACEEIIGNSRTASVDHCRITLYYAYYTMEGRLKIGSQTSSVVAISQPTTASPATDVTVTGLVPATPPAVATVTVEIQARVAAGSGTARSSFTHKRARPQHRDHFV
mgnify:CR=1 FL=1